MPAEDKDHTTLISKEFMKKYPFTTEKLSDSCDKKIEDIGFMQVFLIAVGVNIQGEVGTDVDSYSADARQREYRFFSQVYYALTTYDYSSGQHLRPQRHKAGDAVPLSSPFRPICIRHLPKELLLGYPKTIDRGCWCSLLVYIE